MQRCMIASDIKQGDEIANVNFFYDDIADAEANAYAHWTDFLISTKHLR